MSETEMLARMWIECDPNRGGTDPDELMHFDSSEGGPPSALEGRPHWEWFVPRAEATQEYLAKRGYRLVKADG